jgi:D-inositol-3-phosphate glycosyltransferase
LKNIIVGPAYPLRGGIANFNEALSSALIKNGHSSEIISFKVQYPDFLFPGTSQFDHERKIDERLQIRPLLHSFQPFNWPAVAAYIRKQQPDYVLVRYWLPFMGPCLGTLNRLVKKDTSIPVIAITDNIIPHEKRLMDDAFTRYFVKSCDGFVTMSASVMQDLSKFTDNPMKIFSPHPVYDIFGESVPMLEARKAIGLNESDRIILFFGFIREYKGLDLLLKAMGTETLRHSGVKLVVAGEFYDDAKPYLDLIQQLGIDNNVLLHAHYIADHQVKHYFCACNLVVQPYKHATQSGVTQIAYHFSKPSLVTRVGGLAEIVEHDKTGYVVQKDPEEIARCIKDYFNNSRELEMTAACDKKKVEFTWERMIDNIHDLVNRMKSNCISAK